MPSLSYIVVSITKEKDKLIQMGTMQHSKPQFPIAIKKRTEIKDGKSQQKVKYALCRKIGHNKDICMKKKIHHLEYLLENKGFLPPIANMCSWCCH